ncbi:hypothetical protein OS175_09045 [Marinicella sp. S1101]|uniref:hypothetical protein n=1 Tax=Marinicella marina TaxID=2996016 RepID=UPI00226096B1|nr:hypothetical protein [Marinicella marina]MCX7554022.1 hypothetical protein [Marinicella marina]MDJ1140514.1 hypothetical protein [Marinicella marina]
MALIERALFSPETNFGSLLMIQSICLNLNSCDPAIIQQQLESKHSDNLTTFLVPLRDAVTADDFELVIAILEAMSQADKSQLMHAFNLGYEPMVDAYLKQHPMPEVDYAELEELGVDWQEVSAHELSLSHLLMSDKFLSMIYNSPVAPIYRSCEWSEKTHTLCLKIADIMINKSDNLLSMHVGYELKKKIYEWQDNQPALAQSNEEKESFFNYINCIGKMQSQNNSLDYITDTTAVRLFYEGTDELRYLEEIALYLYDKWQQQGVPNLQDPRTCGLRFIKE